MVRVRFAPSPTGSLHLGGALTAVANRTSRTSRTAFSSCGSTTRTPRGPRRARKQGSCGTWTGSASTSTRGQFARASGTSLYRAAADRLVESGAAYDDEGAVRFRGEHDPTLLRADGSATYHLASVVDDIDLGITHVIRGQGSPPERGTPPRASRRPSAPSPRSTSTMASSSPRTAASSRSGRKGPPSPTSVRKASLRRRFAATCASSRCRDPMFAWISGGCAGLRSRRSRRCRTRSLPRRPKRRWPSCPRSGDHGRWPRPV